MTIFNEASITATADELLIWDMAAGQNLQCVRDVVMTDGGETSFTKGRHYKVTAMLPFTDPPSIRVTNDQDEPHRFSAGDVREFFIVI